MSACNATPLRGKHLASAAALPASRQCLYLLLPRTACQRSLLCLLRPAAPAEKPWHPLTFRNMARVYEKEEVGQHR